MLKFYALRSFFLNLLLGFPVLGIEWQKMENPNLQMEIGMKPDQKGVHNRRIDPTALESKVLNPSDVIPSFDGLILPMME